MKTLTNPETFAFTNHFNQSLLKNRITMMNKAKSSWLAAGKYLLFVGVLMAIFAISKSPHVIQPSKYILRTENTLEWVVTPKMNLNDLANLSTYLSKEKILFQIEGVEIDHLGHFIRSIRIKYKSNDEVGYAKVGYLKQTAPINCLFYRFDLVNKKLLVSRKQANSPIYSIADNDESTAKNDFRNNIWEYELTDLQKEYGYQWEHVSYLSSTGGENNNLPFISKKLGSTPIQNHVPLLKLRTQALSRKNAIIRLNGGRISHDYLQTIDFQTIKSILTFDCYGYQIGTQHIVLLHTF